MNYRNKNYYIYSAITFAFIVLLLCSFSREVKAQSHPISRIAIVLPFKSTTMEAKRSLEFYRGMLLAADDLKRQGYNTQISAFNEPNSQEDITLLLDQTISISDLVSGFAYRDHMIAAGNFCKNHGVKIYFPLASYIPAELDNNPYANFTLAHTEQQAEVACKLLVSTLGKSSVIYVTSQDAHNQNEVSSLASSLRDKGCKLKTLSMTSSVNQLEDLFTTKRPNIVLTDISDETSMTSLLSTLNAIACSKPQCTIAFVVTPQIRDVFAMTTHHAWNFDIYNLSLWHATSQPSARNEITNKYIEWFHCEPLVLSPSPLLQGYDFATTAIIGTSIAGKDINLYSPAISSLFYNYRLCQRSTGKCFTNEAVRIYRTTKQGHNDIIELQGRKRKSNLN